MRTILALAASVAALFIAGAAAPAKGGVVGSAVFTATVQHVHEEDGTVIVLKQIKDRHGTVVGWGDTVCFLLGNGSSQCMGTFVLPEGKINVAGTRHNQDFFVLSIVGGTGVYGGSGGSLIANTVSLDSPRVERLVFFLS